jgi:Ala-tRNA(Pro) deacylase
MLVMPGEKRLDIKAFTRSRAESKMSFVKAEFLDDVLKTSPGSCSPFGLIFDKEKLIELFVDQQIVAAPIVCFHPNRNDQSLELNQENFQKFLLSLKHQIHQVEL